MLCSLVAMMLLGEVPPQKSPAPRKPAPMVFTDPLPIARALVKGEYEPKAQVAERAAKYAGKLFWFNVPLQSDDSGKPEFFEGGTCYLGADYDPETIQMSVSITTHTSFKDSPLTIFALVSQTSRGKTGARNLFGTHFTISHWNQRVVKFSMENITAAKNPKGVLDETFEVAPKDVRRAFAGMRLSIQCEVISEGVEAVEEIFPPTIRNTNDVTRVTYLLPVKVHRMVLSNRNLPSIKAEDVYIWEDTEKDVAE